MHAQDEFNPPAPKRVPWNKGKLTGPKATAPAEACLGDPDKATNCGPQAGLGALQSGRRQQAERL